MSGIDWVAHMRRLIDRVGVDATWRSRASGASVEVRGLYKQPATVVELGLAGFATSKPQFECIAADVVDIGVDDAIEIQGVCFTVAEAPARDPVSGLVVLDLQTV